MAKYKNLSGLRAQAERRTAKLAFGSKAAYSIEELESGTRSRQELRREYSRLRGIVSKRLQRLEASEFAFEGQRPYTYQPERYKPLKDIKSERELAILLRDLAGVVESPRSRIIGLEDIRERSVETMRQQGYDWITTENWKDFSNFMKTARAMANNRMFDSERAVEIFASAKATKKGTKNKNELKKAFKAYLDELDAQTSGIPEVKR